MAAALDQHDQEIHRLAAEFHCPPAAAQFVRRKVELEIAETEGLVRARCVHGQLTTTLTLP
jgi:hypothetical protein